MLDFLGDYWGWLLVGWFALFLIGLFIPVRRFLSRRKKAEWLITHRPFRGNRSSINMGGPTINFDDPNWRDQIKAVYGNSEDED